MDRQTRCCTCPSLPPPPPPPSWMFPLMLLQHTIVPLWQLPKYKDFSGFHSFSESLDFFPLSSLLTIHSQILVLRHCQQKAIKSSDLVSPWGLLRRSIRQQLPNHASAAAAAAAAACNQQLRVAAQHANGVRSRTQMRHRAFANCPIQRRAVAPRSL